MERIMVVPQIYAKDVLDDIKALKHLNYNYQECLERIKVLNNAKNLMMSLASDDGESYSMQSHYRHEVYRI